jgi:Tfp pilus assembly protein FimT
MIRANNVANAGFTLVEAAIVMVAVGLLTAMSIPKLSAGLQQRAVSSAANEFVLAHSFARSTALRYGRVAQLHIDASMARFWVDVDTSGTSVRDTVGLPHDLAAQGIQLTTTRAVLCFDARGFATTNATCAGGDVTVVLMASNWLDTVRTTTLGKVLR